MNVKRQQKTFDAFNRLPDEFTVDDVMRCFSMSNNGSARKKITRLLKDHLIEKMEEFCENNTHKAKYKKTDTMML